MQYPFSPKRNLKLITPCCNKLNKDGKFANFKGFDDVYGYCHSCGKTTLPNAKNTITNNAFYNAKLCKKNAIIKQQYIKESVIWGFYELKPENNLLQYLRNTYCNKRVETAKQLYCLGTSKDGGCIYWNISIALKVQKSKICYYNKNGKRTNNFKVPYKNEDGYYACLFGEHLISDENKKEQPIILVESEKSALVGFINLPKYTWLSYGGLNGLTDSKIKVLKGYKVIIIPDISKNAVRVMQLKIAKLDSKQYNIKIWDMRNGLTDEQLKEKGIYNNDLEDYFRAFKNILA